MKSDITKRSSWFRPCYADFFNTLTIKTRRGSIHTAAGFYPNISIKMGNVTKQPKIDRHAPVAAYSSSAP